MRALLGKVKHQYGRHYGAYLTPTELLKIDSLGAKCKSSDIKRATAMKQVGNMRGNWYYFDIIEGTDLFRKITNS